MEGSPKEEVFLGAFQFQPENIIQTFQLQVREKPCPCWAPTEHTRWAGLYRGPHFMPQQPEMAHSCH